MTKPILIAILVVWGAGAATAQDGGPASVSGDWVLKCGHDYGGNFATPKKVALQEGPTGGLFGTIEGADLRFDSSGEWNGGPPPLTSMHAGGQLNLVVHPAGWISIIQFKGSWNGSGFEGPAHHYGNDDTRCTLSGGGAAASSVAGDWLVTFPHDFGGALTSPKKITLKEGPGGALSGTFETGEILADSHGDWNQGPPPMRSQLSGGHVNLVLHVGGWISIIQLEGAWSGARIEGKFHHYTSDDGAFTMARAGSSGGSSAGHDDGGPRSGVKVTLAAWGKDETRGSDSVGWDTPYPNPSFDDDPGRRGMPNASWRGGYHWEGSNLCLEVNGLTAPYPPAHTLQVGYDVTLAGGAFLDGSSRKTIVVYRYTGAPAQADSQQCVGVAASGAEKDGRR